MDEIWRPLETNSTKYVTCKALYEGIPKQMRPPFGNGSKLRSPNTDNPQVTAATPSPSTTP